jgi:FkbM family methyltransferase
MRNFWGKLNVLPLSRWPGFIYYYVITALAKRIDINQIEVNDTLNFIRAKGGFAKSTSTSAQISLQLEKRNASFHLRWNSSDFAVFNEIIIRPEYQPLFDFLTESNSPDPVTILDIGANIGITSVLFCCKYPKAKVYALEPDLQNFQGLKKNIIENNLTLAIVPVHGAVWSKRATLDRVSDGFRDGRDWSFQFKETFSAHGGDSVQAYSLMDLAEQFEISRVDILKIDIEGGEKELVLNDRRFPDFLRFVKLVVIEVHRQVIPIEQVLDFLKDHGFQVRSAGSLIVAHK